MATAPLLTKTQLWDLPVRLVHWGMVFLVTALWWTGETGRMETHKTIGLSVLALVLFRLSWGFAGSRTARFSSFVRGPRAIIDYIRSGTTQSVGHNPLGALSVLALLGLLAVQVGSGLFAQDVDGIESGPLAYLVSYDTADMMREFHHAAFNVLLALIALHVATIGYYRLVKRNDLVTPMITGHKELHSTLPPPPIASNKRALLLAAISAGVAWWISIGVPLPA